MASTSRDRDRGRRYLGGNQKQALEKVVENKKQRGTITKFFVTTPVKCLRIENEEDTNDLKNHNTGISQITVNDEIDNKPGS